MAVKAVAARPGIKANQSRPTAVAPARPAAHHASTGVLLGEPLSHLDGSGVIAHKLPRLQSFFLPPQKMYESTVGFEAVPNWTLVSER